MAEQAYRKSDNKKINIGTCSSMYYIRFEDRFKVDKEENSIDPHRSFNLKWRLPIPEEDDILPGDYIDDQPFIERYGDNHYYQIHEDCKITVEEEHFICLAECSGIITCFNEWLGLDIKFPCYHGLKLNESKEGINFSWNSKRDTLCLYSITNNYSEIMIDIYCTACHKMFSCSFNEIQNYIKSVEMQTRLYSICCNYWEKKNPGEVYPFPITRIEEKNKYKLNRSFISDEYKYVVEIQKGDQKATRTYCETLDTALHVYKGYQDVS